jgi:hypothetical protein
MTVLTDIQESSMFSPSRSSTARARPIKSATTAFFASIMVAVSLWAPAHAGEISVGGWFGRTEGSGKAVDDVRNLAGFSAIKLRGGIDAVLKAGSQERVIVHADDNLLPMIEATVENGVLVLGTRKGASFHSRNPVVVTVEFKDMNSIAISGSGDVKAERISNKRFDVGISGSGDVLIDNLATEILAVAISGNGDFKASGMASTQGFSISGSGDVEASDLKGNKVAVHIAGSGDARVNATETLDVSIAGSGDVSYRGKPVVKQSIAGSGSVQAQR